MAEKQVFLSGKCKFCNVTTPDKFGFYGTNLYLDDASKIVWQRLKEEGIMNRLRGSEDGEFVTLRCPEKKKIRGEMRLMDKPSVVKDGLPYVGMIGNGSDLTCMVTVYDYKKPMTQEKGVAIRLRAIKINNLIEPSTTQFPGTGHQDATALIKQPDPIW